MKLVTWVAWLVMLVAGCNGREATPDCHDAGEYCHSRDGGEMCCIPAFPYCGKAGTDCAEGYCCNAPPKVRQTP